MEDRRNKIECLLKELNENFNNNYEYQILFDNASFWIKEDNKPKVHVSLSSKNNKIIYFPEDIPLSQLVDDNIKEYIEKWAELNGLKFVDMHNVYLNRLSMERKIKKE